MQTKMMRRRVRMLLGQWGGWPGMLERLGQEHAAARAWAQVEPDGAAAQPAWELQPEAERAQPDEGYRVITRTDAGISLSPERTESADFSERNPSKNGCANLKSCFPLPGTETRRTGEFILFTSSTILLYMPTA